MQGVSSLRANRLTGQVTGPRRKKEEETFTLAFYLFLQYAQRKKVSIISQEANRERRPYGGSWFYDILPPVRIRWDLTSTRISQLICSKFKSRSKLDLQAMLKEDEDEEYWISSGEESDIGGKLKENGSLEVATQRMGGLRTTYLKLETNRTERRAGSKSTETLCCGL